MASMLIGTVLPWLLIAVGTWLGYQLVRQNGRILLRLESIEKQFQHRPAAKKPSAGGLPVGTVAPDFELPDLTGRRRTLAEFREQSLLLIFFNPQCGFCSRMAADLAALPTEGGKERPIPIVITTGDSEENRKLVEHFGIRCLVLLQEQMEVASQYRVQGTPMGYLVDDAGRIASELATGAEPLLKLATVSKPDTNEPGESANGFAPGATGGLPASANGSATHGKHDDPSLVRSRLNRSGLKAGAQAPDFRLPRIDGGELSLADFRGTRVLLVFSSPDCGPCDELAPSLQEIHSEQSDLQVLVVSRHDAEANRTKADKFGLTYPIVLQKQWEISLKYAMFATPIGYLIDERGDLASDVAVGVGPILSLLDEPRDRFGDEVSVLTQKEQAWTI